MDHAGLSQPLEPLKELNSLLLDLSLPTLNNNSLTAQDPSETTDVTEVLWIVHSNILNKIHFKLKLTIHTLQLMELANMFPQRELVK